MPQALLSERSRVSAIPGRAARLLLLAMLVVELLPRGPSAWLVAAAALLCWLGLSGLKPALSATAGGALLGALALVDTTAWIGASVVVLGASALSRARSGRNLGLAIAAGMGIVFPLLLGAVMAGIDPDAGRALLLGVDLRGSLTEQTRRAAALLACIALAAGALDWLPGPERSARPGKRLAERLTLLALSVALAAWLGLRGSWIASTVSLRTDLLVWSEAPALLNLLKLRAGVPFYGAPELVNSYSYSPGLELLQYSLLRPLGLELSLRAHRLLGLCWQLASSGLVLVALRAWLPRALSTGRALVLVAAPVLAVVLSSLLAPHVHPDHALMVCFSAALWLVLDEQPLAAGRRRGARAALLVLVPIAATAFKLTGAGVGLGLAAAYAWQRDWRRLGLLVLAGAGALATIPLFDATLGSFSRYAIGLQASHPLEWWRASTIPASPAGMVWGLSLLVLGVKWAVAPQASETRAATRAALLTAGFGVTSLLAFVKHGGRENSLLPLAIGGAVVLLLCALGEKQSDEQPAARGPTDFGLAQVAALTLALALLASPPFEPIPAANRARLAEMHERHVAWLRSGSARKLAFWTSSMAAYIDAGGRAVPRDVLGSAVELELGQRPEFAAFAQRISGAHYDGLAFQSSLLFEEKSWRGFVPALKAHYRVVGPPELAGQWPQTREGYVLLEK